MKKGLVLYILKLDFDGLSVEKQAPHENLWSKFVTEVAAAVSKSKQEQKEVKFSFIYYSKLVYKKVDLVFGWLFEPFMTREPEQISTG